MVAKKVVIGTAIAVLGCGLVYLTIGLMEAKHSASKAERMLQLLDSNYGKPVTQTQVQAWVRQAPQWSATRDRDAEPQSVTYAATYSNRLLAWSRMTDLSGISFALTVQRGELIQAGILAGTTNQRTGAWIYADTWLFGWGKPTSPHPRYEAFKHLLKNGRVAGLWVGIRPGVNPEDLRRSLSFDTHCIEGFHRCWSASEFLPGVAGGARNRWISQ